MRSLAGVVAHDVFFRVISFPHDRQRRHIEAGLLQLLDRFFRLGVLVKQRNE